MIEAAIAALGEKVGEDDLAIFYFSGHVATVGEGHEAKKVMYPTDGDFDKGGYIRVDDVVKSFGALGAKNSLVVIDG